jgi:hypothetical protein
MDPALAPQVAAALAGVYAVDVVELPPAEKVDEADDVARAVEEAEAALAAAEGASARRAADLVAGAAEARQRAQAVGQTAQSSQQATKALVDEIDDALAAVQRDLTDIESRRLGQAGGARPDEAYRTVRALSQRLHGDPAARSAELIAAKDADAAGAPRAAADRRRMAQAATWIDEIDAPARRVQLRAVVEDWEASLRAEQAAIDARVVSAGEARGAILTGLGATREYRRTLRPYVSRGQLSADNQYLIEDVGQELGLLGPTLALRARDRIAGLVNLPQHLTDYNLLRALFGSLLWAGVWGLAWLWGRSQADEGARLIGAQIRRLRPEFRPTDLAALRDPTARFLRAFVDLLLGWLLVGRLGALVPELGFVLVVYLQLALYLALLAGFDLAVVPVHQVRPAILVMREEPWALARRTFQWAVGLLIARAFLHRLLWDALGLDVVAGWVAWFFTLALVVLAVWAMHQWEPHLRARVRHRNQDFPLVGFLSREPEGRLTQAPRGLAIALFFVVVAGIDLVYLLARERAGVAWLVTAVNRLRGREEGSQPVMLDDAERLRITTDNADNPSWLLERPEVQDAVVAAVEAWQSGTGRGLVAVVGDRGSGKRTALAGLRHVLEKRELTCVEATLDHVCATEHEVLDWLADVAGVGRCDSPEALHLAIEALPSQVFLFQGLHRAWSRRVAGFDGMSALLYVLDATSDHHFYVASMHRLSWDFLASTGSLLDMGVFRCVVPLTSLTASQIQALTLARADRAGFSVDFSSLVRPSAFGGDPAIETERASNLFYRVLAEASEGSARVSLQLFSRCLVRTEDPRVLGVALSEDLRGGILERLLDPALFALVALRIQDEVTDDELEVVTNLPRPVLRATVRDLISRGLVQRHEGILSIPDLWLPAVSRTLRRRHLLHLGRPL